MSANEVGTKVIGPSPFYVLTFLRSWSWWACLALFAFTVSPLFYAFRSPLANHLLYYANHYHVGHAAGFVGLALAAMSFVRGLSTHYHIDESSLVVEHGFFSRYSRSGRLSKDVNSVALNLIADADYPQGILGAMIGTGCLSIRTVGGETVVLPMCEEPARVRAMLMSRSGVKAVKVLARMNE